MDKSRYFTHSVIYLVVILTTSSTSLECSDLVLSWTLLALSLFTWRYSGKCLPYFFSLIFPMLPTASTSHLRSFFFKYTYLGRPCVLFAISQQWSCKGGRPEGWRCILFLFYPVFLSEGLLGLSSSNWDHNPVAAACNYLITITVQWVRQRARKEDEVSALLLVKNLPKVAQKGYESPSLEIFKTWPGNPSLADLALIRWLASANLNNSVIIP